MPVKPVNKLSILIPFFNEEKTLSEVLDRVISADFQEGIEREIILIDDASSDQSMAVINQYKQSHTGQDLVVVSHDKNSGKGAAIHTGIAKATGDYILIQDADLEYHPEDYHRLLQPIIDGKADVVYGSRFMGGRPHRILFFWHSLGNRFLTFFSNMFTNLNLTDMETGYKVFDATMLKGLKLKERRFGFEPEVTAKISRIDGVRIYEVGISYFGRTYKEGKKINWKDGFRALYCILRYNLFN